MIRYSIFMEADKIYVNRIVIDVQYHVNTSLVFLVNFVFVV